MPENAVYVGRPTKWGNPWTIASALSAEFAEEIEDARAVCVDLFRSELRNSCSPLALAYPSLGDIRSELRGEDLACWCPLDQPCHADVLLEWANA